MKHRILRLPEVKTSTGLSRSTIYFRMAEGSFPKQIALGPRTVGWLENDVQGWLKRQIQTSRSSEPNPKAKTADHGQFGGKRSCDEIGNSFAVNEGQKSARHRDDKYLQERIDVTGETPRHNAKSSG